MKKHFILDTNVVLHDPDALFRLRDNVVIVPIHVIAEIDHFKKEVSKIEGGLAVPLAPRRGAPPVKPGIMQRTR